MTEELNIKNKFYIDINTNRYHHRGQTVSSKCLNIGSYKKEFVPLLAINKEGNEFSNYRSVNFSSRVDVKYANHYNSLSPYAKYIIKQSLAKLEVRGQRWRSIEVTNNKEYLTVLGDVVNIFNNYIKSPFYYKVEDSSMAWGDSGYYDDLFNHFWKGSDNNQLKFRSRTYPLSYTASPYVLSEWDKSTGNIETLVMIITQPKYIPIIRASFILGEPIDTRFLQLWVRDDFDIPHSRFKNIRPRYRKQIKAVCADADIPIIEVTKKDFASLFNHYTIPKTNNPKEYKDCLFNLYNQFITNQGDDFSYLKNYN